MAGSGRRSKRASMKDVANLAGVSPTTVSFVINQAPNTNIPEETQERVWDAVRELNYRPNAMARGLRAQRTQTIGFISDVVATTPFAGRIIQGAQDQAWEHNYLLLLINTGGDRAVEEAAVDALLERQVDGIIYATMYHRRVTPPDTLREAPTVLLDCFVEDGSLPSVVPDEFKGGYDATRYLLDAGHRRIGYVGDEAAVVAQIRRQEGYQQALAEFDIPFDATLTSYGITTPSGGYAGAHTLLTLPNPPTALFCFNDRMAMGAYEAARELGLRIPDDLAIIGYDDQEVVAADLRPGLTTMRLPHSEMGRWAVEHLLHLLESGSSAGKPAHQLIECPLIARASV